MRFFIGLLLGVGLGVAIGLVIAPQSGDETRAQLAQQGIQLPSGALSDDLRTRATGALAQGRDLYARTKNELTSRYNNAKAGTL